MILINKKIISVNWEEKSVLWLDIKTSSTLIHVISSDLSRQVELRKELVYALGTGNIWISKRHFFYVSLWFGLWFTFTSTFESTQRWAKSDLTILSNTLACLSVAVHAIKSRVSNVNFIFQIKFLIVSTKISFKIRTFPLTWLF